MAESAISGVTILGPENADLRRLIYSDTHFTKPFAPERLQALGALSSYILSSDTLRRDPAASSLGFWLRPAHLTSIASKRKQAWKADVGRVRYPAGRIYHIAPSNVDTLFLYSWALSFICGNVDIVRLPSQRSPLASELLNALSHVSRQYSFMQSVVGFIAHPHDNTITTFFSDLCDHRIVWGGDETVLALRSIPLNAHSSERSFAGKMSHAVVNAAALLDSDDAARVHFATLLFRDLFWFSQRACSSPRTLFWLGSPTNTQMAIALVEQHLTAEAMRRGYSTDVSDAVRRFQFVAEWAIHSPLTMKTPTDAFLGVEIPNADSWKPDHCGGGLLVHLRVDCWQDIVPLLNREHQTLVHYGLQSFEVHSLAEAAALKGVDRIVPVGEALAFEEVWDGYDLLNDFTRVVTVRE